MEAVLNSDNLEGERFYSKEERNMKIMVRSASRKYNQEYQMSNDEADSYLTITVNIIR